MKNLWNKITEVEPAEGQQILAVTWQGDDRPGVIVLGYWQSDENGIVDQIGGYSWKYGFTHWMPVPPLPQDMTGLGDK